MEHHACQGDYFTMKNRRDLQQRAWVCRKGEHCSPKLATDLLAPWLESKRDKIYNVDHFSLSLSSLLSLSFSLCLSLSLHSYTPMKSKEQLPTSPLLLRPYSCLSICSKLVCCSSVWWKALLTMLLSISLLTMGEKGCSRPRWSVELSSLGCLFAVSWINSSSSSESTAGSLASWDESPLTRDMESLFRLLILFEPKH